MHVNQDVTSITTPNAVLQDTVLLEIVNRLEVVSSKDLFLPFGSQSQIRTTRDDAGSLTYVVKVAQSTRAYDSSALHVTASGLIVTGAIPLAATVFITDSYKGFNQTVAVFVQVTAVAQVSITPTALLGQSGSHAAVPYTMATGLSAELTVKLHDVSGRAFDACDSSLIEV